MKALVDGPSHDAFQPAVWRGNAVWGDLAAAGLSAWMSDAAAAAPRGACVFRGLRFQLASRPLVLSEGAAACGIGLRGVRARWFVFAHTSDLRPLEWNGDGLLEHSTGEGHLGELAATYVLRYTDGTEVPVPIRRRHQVGAFYRRWGENCVEAVAHPKPKPIRQAQHGAERWGWTQRRATVDDSGPWIYWLWAWENPHPRKPVAGIRFEPGAGSILVSGLSFGNCAANPLRWGTRRKAILRLPAGQVFDPTLDAHGNLGQAALDLGVVISATPRPIYPHRNWPQTPNNQLPAVSDREVLVEYTAHADARLHLGNGRTVAVKRLAGARDTRWLTPLKPADQRVIIRVLDGGTGRPVAARLHLHGEGGEYLPPLNRQRQPNPNWFEDYSPEYQHNGLHKCVYIDGETDVRLPLGTVYLEVWKGFEIRPIRETRTVTRGTRELVIEIEKVLPWRERGWVTADTHVHFLSPTTGLLEGAAEGVNVVNLLASQWGELMTNAGDFDGRTTHGSSAGGGDGEYLLRVGTENRHHVLGHISLIGYNGPMIVPMTSGGPDESALGDPVEVLLTEWARQCRQQGGVVVIPHFPNPRLEHAATIIEGDADAVEMTAWGNQYGGIDPYSLSDWYRYLNNGYLVGAVAGTDKMSATTAVGTVRTYARLQPGQPFTYEAWMNAVRRAETFATYGPLIEFSVDGRAMGSRIAMTRSGGTVDVTWEAASVTVPMTRVELVANGEIVDGQEVDADRAGGTFRHTCERSTWLALLVRGHHPGKPEIIAAHSSPIMVDVERSPFYCAADALTILAQIEGAMAYLDTVGTRAENDVHKRMRLILTSAHRKLHNRMHECGVYHDHTTTNDHEEHRG